MKAENRSGRLAVACACALACGAAFAYQDDYIETEATPRVIELGGDVVYVFSNAVDVGVARTVTARKAFTLKEALVVGGGGGGGQVLGGGGGGGQVLHHQVPVALTVGNALTLTIGAGGATASGMNSGYNGGHSSVVWPDSTTSYAYGGGGGGAFSSNGEGRPAAVTGEIGSGGGAKLSTDSGSTKGTYYNYGNRGGSYQGGGGGAGLPGENGGVHSETVLYDSETTYRKQAGYGGEGLTNYIIGAAEVYGSGGGGGGGQNFWSQVHAPGGTHAGAGATRSDKSGGGDGTRDALPADPGFGAGGGGGSFSQTGSSGSNPASAGGCGTVILRIVKSASDFFSIGGAADTRFDLPLALPKPTFVSNYVDGVALTEGVDYTLTCDCPDITGLSADRRTALIVAGMAGTKYEGYQTQTYFTLIANHLSVSSVPGQLFFGAAVTPAVTVTDAETGATLVKDTNYSVAYANNTSVGTATVTVTGLGKYAGNVVAQNFTIAAPAYQDDYVMASDASVAHTNANGNLVYVFTNAALGDVAFAFKSAVTVLDVLAVGGGGGGGGCVAGGGGGGGVVSGGNATLVAAGTACSVTVGAGGIAGAAATGTTGQGGNGGHSRLALGSQNLSAYGGGGGGAFGNYPGSAEVTGEIGSGGGCGQKGGTITTDGVYYNATQGHRGGTVVCGGGGGAGETASGNAGGEGLASDITGVTEIYGAGGGGGAGNGYNTSGADGGTHAGRGTSQGSSDPGEDGEDGYGAGGGGGGFGANQQPITAGGKGGSGVVIFAFQVGDFTTYRFAFAPIPDQYYTMSAIEPTIVVTNPVSGATLVKDVDYTLAITNNTSVGTATVTVTGNANSNYAGFKAVRTFAIREPAFTVATIPNQMYVGETITPEVTVTRDYDGAILSAESDYVLTFSGNTSVGTATATATGRAGTRYAGLVATRDFEILAPGYQDEFVYVSDNLVNVTTVGGAKVYCFTNVLDSGAVVKVKQLSTLMDYLLVGGGGGGGSTCGGGGGGGGVVVASDLTLLAAGSTVALSVGAGGAGGPAENSPYPGGSSGGHSWLTVGGTTTSAYGGGGGGSYSYSPKSATVANEIGSAGGNGQNEVVTYVAGTHYNATQGHAGGTGAFSGGGGAYSAGKVYDSTNGGRGGEGLTNAITGVAAVYGSGGGNGGGNSHCGALGGTNAGRGYGNNSGLGGESAPPGFGGGGGGGSFTPITAGGDGGSGAVILAFKAGDKVNYRFTILPIADCWFEGTAAEPNVVVSNFVTGAVLTRDVDYTLAFTDNDKVGTATVTATGKAGTLYADYVATQTFTLKAQTFTIQPIADQMYLGSPCTPEVTVLRDHDGATLEKDADYTLSFSDNGAVGTATATATGKAGTAYAGLSATKTFKIVEVKYDEYVASDDFSMRSTNVDNRLVYIFTNVSKTAQIKVLQTLTLKDALVVGGGGAGGTVVGSGGGGGGVVTQENERIVFEGAQFNIVVGNGGASVSSWTQAGSGGASSVTLAGNTIFEAYGGGGGAGFSCGSFAVGNFGSCGGGPITMVEGAHYTAGQGHAGGKSTSGGGGGAGEPGKVYNATDGGVGGEGITNAITGVAEVYGSGGGGGAGNSIAVPGRGGTHGGRGSYHTSGIQGESGDNGFGAGGGGGCYGQTATGFTPSQGGRGGSGIVVLAFEVGGEVGQPEIATADLDFPYGTTQPRVTVTLGGKSSATYAASVTVQMGTDGETWLCSSTATDVPNGGSASALGNFSPATDSDIHVHVLVSAEGAQDRVTNLVVKATNPQSPYAGKGGGANIVHVRAGATGVGDGSDWFNACTDFREGLKLLSASRPELWFAGDEQISLSPATISPSAAATIRGGFAGQECSLAERPAGARSVIKGAETYTSISFNNANAVTLEAFQISGGGRCLYKSGNGNLTVTNCVFPGFNGPNGYEALAASVTGSGAEVRFVDTYFAKHYLTDSATPRNGGAIYASSLKRLYLDSCTFVSNGVPFSEALGSNRAYAMMGAVFYANGAPVTMRNCVVKGNRSASLDYGSNYYGGVIRMDGNCGGSVFSNCIFAANESVHGYGNYTDYPTDNTAGLFSIGLSSAAQTVDMVNCTFAYNLAETANAPAGINLRAGTLNLVNSILFGSVARHQTPVARELLVKSGAVANVRYTLFEDLTDDCVSALDGGTLNLGEGVIAGDPLLVAPQSEFAAFVTSDGWRGFIASKEQALLAWANVHLRGRIGYVDEVTGLKVRFGRAVSPAIDAGDPASSYALEPEEAPVGTNGKRINLGCYGNTPYATKTLVLGNRVLVR